MTSESPLRIAGVVGESDGRCLLVDDDGEEDRTRGVVESASRLGGSWSSIIAAKPVRLECSATMTGEVGE